MDREGPIGEAGRGLVHVRIAKGLDNRSCTMTIHGSISCVFGDSAIRPTCVGNPGKGN